MGNEVCERKVNTVDQLFGRTLDGAASIKGRECRLKQHSNFAQKLQSALRMTVGFSDIYGKVRQNYHLCVTNLSFKHKRTVKSKINFTVSNISFFITIHNVFVSVNSNSSLSVTIQEYTHVQMTDIITIIITIITIITVIHLAGF
jgi:hypothetical protein